MTERGQVCEVDEIIDGIEKGKPVYEGFTEISSCGLCGLALAVTGEENGIARIEIAGSGNDGTFQCRLGRLEEDETILVKL